MIVAIDGPSGAGKSTLGKMVAAKFGLLYLDTGAMYRVAALAALRHGVLADPEASARVVSEARIEMKGEPASVFLNGEDVTAEIRTPEIAQAASVISTISAVRLIMVEHQREIGRSSEQGCVLEGRDIGTVVFPEADVKIFLTATPEARARRRYEEDKAKGTAADLEKTLAEINERDKRDVTREDSPLRIADEAVVIDTSELDLSDVFERICTTIGAKQAAG